MNVSIVRRVGTTALILVAGWSLAACGSAESRRDRALEKGQHYLDAGNYDKARVEFRNALQLTPNDGRTRYLNGLVQEHLGNARESVNFFQGALAVNDDLVDARVELARIFVLANLPDKALELLTPGLEKHPDSARMLALRGLAKNRSSGSEAGLPDAERAYQIDPKSEDVISVLAGMYSADKQWDKAREVLERGIEAHPDGTPLRSSLAELYISSHENDKAEATLREVIRRTPDDVGPRLRLAHLLSGTGRDADAEAELRAGLKALPNDPRLRTALISFLIEKKGKPAAEAEFVRMIGAGDPDGSAAFGLAALYLGNGERDKAEATYRAVIKAQGTRPAGLEARTRLGAVLAERGDRAAAAKLVAEVLEQSAHDAGALELRAALELAANDPKAAVGDLRAVLRDLPNSVPVRRQLARAHIMTGEFALAEEALRQGVEGAPQDVGIRIELANFLVGQGKAAQAKEVLASFAEAHPADLTLQSTLFRASAAAKDYALARVAADRVVAAHPESPVGPFFLGLLAEQAGSVEGALKEYDAALVLQPDAVEPIEAITRLLIAQKRVPDAVKRLEQAAERAPKSGVPLAFKGELLLSERRLPEADAALQAAIERSPEWWVPYRTRAKVLVARGDLPGAKALLVEALGKVKEPNLIRLEQAQLLSATGDHDGAITIYESMLKATPGELTVANNLAYALATYRSDAASLARAGQVAAPLAASSNARYLDTYGWVKLKQGDAPAAIAVLEKAIATLPLPEFKYHLALAALASGQRDRAKTLLGEALDKSAPFPGRDDAEAQLAKLHKGA